MGPTPLSYLRVIAFWAMLLPFSATALIGKGVMPVIGSNGIIMLVICTGQGMIEMPVDAVTMEPVATADGGSRTPAASPDQCTWAMAHPGLDLPIDTPILPAIATAGSIAPGLPPTILLVAAETGLPPATGPPSAF
ncbi:hypothetical protein [Pseudogemmobacter bohemicus]|uniref:hypothetical protein n=1 Tax=Pseudogemmobacter bohemicus TaxID=2250708 RepID=UPI000DD2D7AD|nr:hypothetical protein [Pseudogemmobacter bohemicus]